MAVRDREPVAENDGHDGLTVYEYADCPDAPFVPSWNGWEAAPDAAAGGVATRPRSHEGASEERLSGAELERRLAEEARRAFEAGRARGAEEGRQVEQQAHAAADAAAAQTRTQQAAEMIRNFAQERDRYLRAVEQEVVKLALAVAARILRREAQTDPLLLMGAVRVALGQLAASTETRLRVPEAELDLWTEAVALVPNLAVKPTVLPGEGMRRGDCVIETALGSVDLGVRAQLAEIERSLFDRRGAADGEPVVSAGASAGVESAA